MRQVAVSLHAVPEWAARDLGRLEPSDSEGFGESLPLKISWKDALVNAKQIGYPTYIVRSKADQRIRNMLMDTGYDSDGGVGEDVERRNKPYKPAD